MHTSRPPPSITPLNPRPCHGTTDPQVELPPIQYAWLKKFEGDDMFKATIVNQSGLPFAWDKVEVCGTFGRRKELGWMCSWGHPLTW